MSWLVNTMLVACAAPARVVSLRILAHANSSFGDNVRIKAVLRGGSNVGDIAGTCYTATSVLAETAYMEMTVDGVTSGKEIAIRISV